MRNTVLLAPTRTVESCMKYKKQNFGILQYLGLISKSNLSHFDQTEIVGRHQPLLLFSKILKKAQTLHLHAEIWLKNDVWRNALMMQCYVGQVMMTQRGTRSTAPIFLSKPRSFPTIWRMCYVMSPCLTVNRVVWAREVCWQRCVLFLLLDTKIKWMVHVNYGSPVNHLVFS